ncbi:MAG: N-succinylarginine dihydrolase [Oleiphilaceae bacterium]|nr:N-succinylarginine dihydrolase [Oleiphilaceae bacterium]
MTKRAVEANFDGLVGPTHNYAGLSRGNLASGHNLHRVSNPREAALEGLWKMKCLADRGYVQGLLPPHERPHIPSLHALGFRGSDSEILAAARRSSPAILAATASASAMWTANAATVSPSADTPDRRVHFTPANLTAKFHRSIESPVTARMLKSIFADESFFAHHPALPSISQLGDEGAANHTRLCAEYGLPGVELFVYGTAAFAPDLPGPKRFPARQTLEASQAVARLHGLSDRQAVFAQQNPVAIDAGVFHNDVIAVANGRVLFYHEQAFLDEGRVLADIRSRLRGAELEALRVSEREVSLADAVASYLFNSQLLDHPDGGMMMLVPQECREIDSVSAYLDKLVADAGPIKGVEVCDLTQSMRNGGGPACLRLRVILTAEEQAATLPGVMMTDELYERMTIWVEGHYRPELSPADLADPMLLDESRHALDELSGILGLGSVYDFQR